MNLDELNRSVIDEFRANDGSVGGDFAGMPLLLINTIGAKTGKQRTKPLAYLEDDERYVVVASYAGAEHNPPWYYNLKANPEFELEVGKETFMARATEVSEPERTQLFKRVAEKMPVFKEYQAKTSRVIPILVLERI